MYKNLLLALLTSTLAACAQTGSPTQPQATPPAELNACTMDVRQCADGSWAGRSGPKCEFKCPEASSK